MFALPEFGMNHRLYLIGDLPVNIYSDMNKFGSSIKPFMIFLLYWGFFYLTLACISVLFLTRGVNLTVKNKCLEFKKRVNTFNKTILSGSMSCFIIMGCFIYYNTNILNTYKTNYHLEKDSVNYELKYKYFEKAAQPDIYSVNVSVDIFPDKHSINAKAIFKYRNNSSQPINKILLNINDPKDVNFESLYWDRDNIVETYDKDLKVKIFNLKSPLYPNEEIKLTFQLNASRKGFNNEIFINKIVDNGTFFNGTDFFPIVGYLPSFELSEEKARKKYNLPEKSRMHNINDQDALKKTYISQEGSWIDFEAVVSTTEDQIALAPGYLVKEWKENNRRYFHYKMDMPILNCYAFLSGKYSLTKDNWNDVQIEIYHHPRHTRNIPRMIKSIKKSLDYYTTNYSPYQFKQIRIIEFPRYASFAQSLPNTIPYSESIGFIAKINENDSENIDYVFYITAHEVAHQWWAHQVIGGNVQGALMLSESLAQYSSLMVMEKEYGPEKMKKFLKYKLDNYLNFRKFEPKYELPLMLNEHQNYICYQKGSLAFYALKDYLGEKTVNNVLKKFIQDTAFQKPPFTRSIELVEYFKKESSKDMIYLIEDLFEKIIFYKNVTEKAFFTKNNQKYDVEIHSENKKFSLDGVGKEEEIPMNDYIDIGIFDNDNNIIYLQKHKIKSGKNIFNIQVDKKPYKAGIDPINKLIDRSPDSHVVNIEEKIQ